MTGEQLDNGLMDASLRYYVEQSKNWLFFTTLLGTKGWRLDLDDQILLGGDNGLRGYPLRYQDGTARALWTVEQRYFTDWYPFRLFRVGAAVFFDAGRVWGTRRSRRQTLGLLKDAGFGLRFGNSRSGFGNVVHVDVAFPFEATSGISKVQFLVTDPEELLSPPRRARRRPLSVWVPWPGAACRGSGRRWQRPHPAAASRRPKG